MKSFVSLVIFSVILITASAQKFHINTFAGLSNYQGDIQDKRFTFNQSHLALGAGLSYEITEKILLNGGVTFGKVSASDKNNSRNTLRNLNFTSNILEGHLTAEYYFRNLNEYSVSPYVFAGVALYNFSPYTKDSLGNKYYLKPLSTEGQGFLENRPYYKINQVSIPFGGGVKFALNDNVRLGFEVGMRKLFTDYLDDVSTTYADKDLLLLNRGPKAVELAFRGDELKNGATAYPAAGSQRGGAKVKDWYYFTGLTASFRLGTGEGNGGSRNGGKSKTGCPTKVY
jgi:opacity protein-like surface antigen